MGVEFFKETRFRFDITKLQTCVSSILENPDYDNLNNQICITGTSPKDSPLLGSGSLYYKFDENNNKSLRDNPLQETDFTHFLDEFKETYLFEAYSKLSEDYRLGRVRIMSLHPKSCYSFHIDKFPRLHLAIFSEEGMCGMIHDNRVYEVPCNGTVYRVDTTARHTAFNTSFKLSRTHLVADIVS